MGVLGSAASSEPPLSSSGFAISMRGLRDALGMERPVVCQAGWVVTERVCSSAPPSLSAANLIEP